jgi:PAS domain S-box-containing protein
MSALEELWVSLFDALDCGIVVLDGEQRVIGWNAWLRSASEITETEAEGRRLEEIFPNAPLPRVKAAISAALTAGLPTLITHSLHQKIFPLKTRTRLPLIHNVLVGPLSQNRDSFCVLQIVDVTLAVERERVLRRRQNSRYDAVVDSARDVILTLDGNGDIQLANPAAIRQFGYSHQELIGKPVSLLSEDQTVWNDTFRTVMNGHAIHQPLDVVARRRDGSLTYLEVSLSRWVSESQVFVTAILRDVNERRATENALRASEAQFRSFAQASPDQVWTSPPSGEPDWFNDRAYEYTGLSPNQLNWRRIMPADDFAAAAERWAEALATGHRYEVEVRLRRADGIYRWHIMRAVAIRDNNGEITRWIGTNSDIEDQKAAALVLTDLNKVLERRVEERTSQLIQAEEALRQSQKMEALGQLTGGIAHDFNNLLQGIIGSLDRIKKRISEGRIGDVDRFLVGAMSSAERAAALTHRLLAFSRRQPMDPRPVDVGALISTVEELLRRSIGDSIMMKVSTEPELWLVRCDSNQLENALLNLAINARDAMPDGGTVTIACRNMVLDAKQARQRDVRPGDYVCLEIRDTGVGMPDDVKARAFEPFFTTKPIGQGTGLGLSMIYGFVRQSEGSIRIDSEVGKGVTIEICLPRFRGGLDEAVSVIEAPHVEPPETDKIILVVEDESVVRLLIVEVVNDLGYRVLEAADGQSALRILQSTQRVDLLVTDIGLPGLNGRQVADGARSTRPELKVLFMTGYAENAAGKAFLGRGMEIITKPFATEVLARRIRAMVEGAR